jgi:hypothetical protein
MVNIFLNAVEWAWRSSLDSTVSSLLFFYTPFYVCNPPPYVCPTSSPPLSKFYFSDNIEWGLAPALH